MSEIFEVRDYDGAGRRGELTVPRADATVETPALLPVVNPHVQTVPPADLEDTFGAQGLITNSYILHGSDELRDPALEDGLHELLDFAAPIWTDSGSFQLSEYGTIDVTTPEILQFQYDIGSDVATPVDIPTPPDVGREQARTEALETQDRIETAASLSLGEMLVTAPIQGSTHPDLREAAAERAAETNLDIFPIGAVVPLLKEYRFSEIVDVVAAAKRGLPADAPVHLFGAGHPMSFALAAALGCDLFDSAAYALYARDEKYMTVRGTEHLADLGTFPCECAVCTEHDPADMVAADENRRYDLLARHNLAVSFAEIRRIRDAIRRGNLFELLEARAGGHPALRDGYRALLDHVDQLEATDPVAKETFFYLSPGSARRPEVHRYHERLDRLETPDSVLLTEGTASDEFDESWTVRPPFGPVPPGLVDVYPLTGETPDTLDRAAYETAAVAIDRLVVMNPDTTFAFYHDDWPEQALDTLPDRLEVAVLGADHGCPKKATEQSGESTDSYSAASDDDA